MTDIDKEFNTLETHFNWCITCQHTKLTFWEKLSFWPLTLLMLTYSEERRKKLFIKAYKQAHKRAHGEAYE